MKFSEIYYGIQEGKKIACELAAMDTINSKYAYVISYDSNNPYAYISLPKTNSYHFVISSTLCFAWTSQKKERILSDLQGILSCSLPSIHGGITYIGMNLPKIVRTLGLNLENNDLTTEGIWIGWDYGHYPRDYCGLLRKGEKKWTVEEIEKQIFQVVKELETYDIYFDTV